MRNSRAPSVTRKIMSAIHSKNTRPEIALRKALFARGYRFRVNYKQLKGKPDIVLTRARIAIFVDGDFWHGHNWVIRGYGSHEAEMCRYTEYWRKKITDNMERDKKVNVELQRQGWIVLRFWESDVKTNIEKCLLDIDWWYAIMTGGHRGK